MIFFSRGCRFRECFLPLCNKKLKAMRIEEEEWNEKRIEGSLWKNLLRDFHVAAVAVSCPSLFFSPPTNCVYLPLSLLPACISNEVSAIAGKYLQRSSKPRFLSRDGGRNKLRREIKATSWEPADQSTKTLPNLFSLLRSQSDHHFEPRFSIKLESLGLFELKQRRIWTSKSFYRREIYSKCFFYRSLQILWI